MTPIVVDASVLVPVLLNEGAESATEALRGRRLHSPSNIHYEVGQVLRRIARAGTRLEHIATAAFADLQTAPLDITPFAALAPRIWELRANVTVYDAAYVALAEQLRAPLVTLDRRLARAPGIRCETIVPA